MSQFFSGGVNSTPSVPTSFTTDNGVAVPAANNINIVGDNGIVTEGSGSTVTVKFNEDTNTTLGIATSTILTITPPDNDTTTVQVLISGYDSTADLGVGGQIVATIRKTGGVVTVLGTPDIIKNGDPLDIPSGINMSASTFTVVASGGNIEVQATSSSTNTVTWTAITAGQV